MLWVLREKGAKNIDDIDKSEINGLFLLYSAAGL